MKNNGVLKLFLVLAFCGVLSMYALTAESITRLDIDAEKVSGVMYCENLKEGTGIDIETPEHMTQIATAMNQMELKKTEFKINMDELSKMSCITFGYGDGMNVATMKLGSIVFLPDNQLLVSWGNQSGCYNADYSEVLVLAEELGQVALQKDPYSTVGFTIGFPESILE